MISAAQWILPGTPQAYAAPGAFFRPPWRPGQQVLEPRHFHLDLGFSRVCASREDGEDELGAINHLYAERTVEPVDL